MSTFFVMKRLAQAITRAYRRATEVVSSVLGTLRGDGIQGALQPARVRVPARVQRSGS